MPSETSAFHSLSAPVWRASTVLFPDAQAFATRKARFFDGYTYGLAGTPTHTRLSRRLAALEDVPHCVLAPSGLGAINLVNQTVLSAGDHLLCCNSAYGPTQDNARMVMGRYGIEVEFFDPSEGADIAVRFRPRTRLIWIEAPGSLHMQMADVPAIAGVAAAAGIATAMDNTWATPLGFRPLDHGVDFSVQALTKFAGGHSDVLMGSVCTRDETRFRALKTMTNLLGNNVSPDDCALVSRGLDTLALRLARHGTTTLQVATWLAGHPAVAMVACPPLPGDPGHALWLRDFSTAGCLCSVTLVHNDWASVAGVVDRLRVFRIGASWGGTHSLAAVYPLPAVRHADPGFLIRFHLGLEDPQMLIDDLSQALLTRSDPSC
jgi:cystathionine beta-lyase